MRTSPGRKDEDMEQLRPPFGGPCWNEKRLANGTPLHCEEVYGHVGNHISGEDRLVWTPDGVVVGGTLLDDYEDEAGWFWMGWTQHLIGWTFGLIVALVVLQLVPRGTAHSVVQIVVAGIVMALVMLGWDVIVFLRGHRRVRP